MLPDLEKLDKVLELLGRRVLSCNHVNIENCEIYNTTRNTQPTQININYKEKCQTFFAYQELKKEFPDKAFVLHLGRK